MKTFLIGLSLLLQATLLFSQTDTLFWFAAPDVSSDHGLAPKNGAPINLHITAVDETTVTISQPANTSFTPIIFSLNARELRTIRLDTFVGIDHIENYPQPLPVTPGNEQKKAFKITSQPGNISVYYELDNTYNRELFTLKGRNALGTNFFVSTQNFFPNGNYAGAWSGFVVAATENNTRIVVYPNDDWYYFDTNPGDSVVFILNAGETFAFRAASTAPDRHINGVPVKSDKNIVITIYDDSIRKKNTANTTCTSSLSYDIIGDQLIPVNRTGKEYIIVKGQLSNIVEPNCPADGGDRIFITSTEPNTDIIIDGLQVATLTLAGQMLNYPVDAATLHVLATKPVYVTHITGFGGEVGSAVIPSIDNSAGSERVTFSRSPNAGDAFQLNLAVKNKTSIYGVPSIHAFTMYYNGDWTNIPGTYFDYILDSTWIVLKKTPEVNAYLSSLITPGSYAVIENSVTSFHLGIVGGGTTSGCKYGYVSDFSPKPVKQVMQSKDSLQVTISSGIFEWSTEPQEWLILKITDTNTHAVWYDTAAIVTKASGFNDIILLDSGTYKCEIIDMGANVQMPVIKIDGNHMVPWGYPDYEYYLFTIPGMYNTDSTIWSTACDSLVSPSGKYTWYTGGAYFDTIPNAEGFDSLLTVNLIINNSSSAVLSETACGTYTSPAGRVINKSGIYHEVISNSAGCDSIITINLKINTENTIWKTACDSMVSPSGKYTWYTGGAYFDTIPNAEGFDSLLTVNLTVNHSSSAVLNETACFSYVSPSGLVLENSGIYHDVIPNSQGCDSSITINLTVVKLDNTVEMIATTMKSIEEDATYQWLACNSGLDISGATEQMYTPLVTGLYAVRITKDGCTTTSPCQPMTITGVTPETGEIDVAYYPNPFSNELLVDLKGYFRNIEVRIDDMSGKTVLIQKFSRQNLIKMNTTDVVKGIYLLRLNADGKSATFKIVK